MRVKLAAAVALAAAAIAAALNWYQKSYNERAPSSRRGNKTILVTQVFFEENNPTRSLEVLAALAHNVANPNIAAVHLLQPADPAVDGIDWRRGSALDEWRVKVIAQTDGGPSPAPVESKLGKLDYTSLSWQKVCISLLEPVDVVETQRWPAWIAQARAEGRLLLRDAVRYIAAQTAWNHARPAVIVANADIAFDNSLALLHSPDADLGTLTAYFLSRVELPEWESRSELGSQCGPRFVGSHDAFVLVPPLPRPSALAAASAFPLGAHGAENRFLWELEQLGIGARNPCRSILAWHIHQDGAKRSAAYPPVNTHGRSSVAFPDTLISALEPDYPWQRT